jgi:hypothetical protein
MRRELLIATALAVLAAAAVTTGQVPVPRDGLSGGGRIPVPEVVKSAQREEETLELESRLIHPGLSLAESDKGVFGISLTALVVKKRVVRDQRVFGRATLMLEPNAPSFDEFGFPTTGGSLPPVKLECTLNLVRTRDVLRPRRSGVVDVRVPEEWLLYEMQGPKITSRLFLAARAKTPLIDRAYRFLVHDKDGKVKYAVALATPLIEPCHPGCFPEGTAIHVPGGTKPIERVRAGDLVTTVGPDGARSTAKVASVFVSRNRLVEVRTAAGSLLTTETQPFCLADGGLRAAGELKPRVRICCWDGAKRREVAVLSVSATGRQQSVFNLILGDPAIFVANGFLVRSKLPAPAAPGGTERVVP